MINNGGRVFFGCSDINLNVSLYSKGFGASVEKTSTKAGSFVLTEIICC